MASPKTLLHYCQLKMYYHVHRSFSLIINDGHWYCFCKDVPGCRWEDELKNWCLICILNSQSKRQ